MDDLSTVGLYQTILIYQDFEILKFKLFDPINVNSKLSYLYLEVYNIRIEGDIYISDETFAVNVKNIQNVYPYPTMKCSIVAVMKNGDKHTYAPTNVKVVPD